MIEKLWFVIPEAVLLVGVVVVAILGLVRSAQIRNRVPWVAMAFVIGCGVAYPFVFTETAVSESTSLLPGLGRPMGLVACVVGVCLVFMTIGRIDRRYEQAIAEGRDRFDPLRSNRGEYYVFFLLSLAGLMLTCSATDLIWLFLALELTSLPTYVMVAMSRSSRRAQEAAMKYFFLGAMSAAMFLYGFSLLYAATGTVELTEMREILTAQAAEGGISMLAVVGMMLLCSASASSWRLHPCISTRPTSTRVRLCMSRPCWGSSPRPPVPWPSCCCCRRWAGLMVQPCLCRS